MIIKYPRGIEVELSKEEAVEIFYALQEHIVTSIAKHWINYPDGFLEGESIALRMLKEFAKIVNYSYETELLPIFMDLLNKKK